jgi:hypothetical protein
MCVAVVELVCVSFEVVYLQGMGSPRVWSMSVYGPMAYPYV